MMQIINSGIFPYEAAVFYKKSRKATYKYIKENFPERRKDLDEDKFLDQTSNASFYVLGDGSLMVWVDNKPDAIANLSHELFHMTHLVLQEVGVKLTDSSEETYSYLLGHYMRQILNPK